LLPEARSADSRKREPSAECCFACARHIIAEACLCNKKPVADSGNGFMAQKAGFEPALRFPVLLP